MSLSQKDSPKSGNTLTRFSKEKVPGAVVSEEDLANSLEGMKGPITIDLLWKRGQH